MEPFSSLCRKQTADRRIGRSDRPPLAAGVQQFRRSGLGCDQNGWSRSARQPCDRAGNPKLAGSERRSIRQGQRLLLASSPATTALRRGNRHRLSRPAGRQVGRPDRCEPLWVTIERGSTTTPTGPSGERFARSLCLKLPISVPTYAFEIVEAACRPPSSVTGEGSRVIGRLRLEPCLAVPVLCRPETEIQT